MARHKPPVIPDLSVFSARFTTHVAEVARAEILAIAEEEARRLREEITGDLRRTGAPSLRPSTIAAKRAHHLAHPERPLVATGTYADTIQVVEIPTGDRNQIRITIGHDPQEMARYYDGTVREGVTMTYLEQIHEHGAPRANIPARPHLRKAMAALHKRLAPLVVSRWKTR